MLTLSFRDQLKIAFWDYQWVHCHNSYNEEIPVKEKKKKKSETKTNDSITITYYHHIRVWWAVWHLEHWCFVTYLIFESAVIQIKFNCRVMLLCWLAFRQYSVLTSLLAPHLGTEYTRRTWVLLHRFTPLRCTDSEWSVYSF